MKRKGAKIERPNTKIENKKKGLSEKLNRERTETGGIVLGKYNVHFIFLLSLLFNFQSIPEKSY